MIVCAFFFSSSNFLNFIFFLVALCLFVVFGFLVAVASLVVEHRLQAHRLSNFLALERWLSSCSVGVKLFGGKWNLPRSGIEPMSPHLPGRFLSTEPPGKTCFYFLQQHILFQEHKKMTPEVPIILIYTFHLNFWSFKAMS